MDIDRVDAIREGYSAFTSTSFQAASGKAFEELQFSTTTSDKGVSSSSSQPLDVTKASQAALIASREAVNSPNPTEGIRGSSVGSSMQLSQTNNRVGNNRSVRGSPSSSLVSIKGSSGLSTVDPTVSAAAKVLFSKQV